ncbi:hypothetical protein EDB81DRAFT_860559 [Dactylonectria macrodidyma]|uniref:Uncharacterized protein n=1 Tax=Dactylonectria macrodidyma TaxID=307937 RepID=A0A9P9DTQ7_9HYPO|nr:hypothetical protein EDB81DRAFT_860559 [Dactylonectria macrodidyma]
MPPNLLHTPGDDGSFHCAPPPTIRLQVWYYSDRGMSLQLNQSLGQFLRQRGVDDWVIKPAIPSISPENCRHNFVPLEVELEWDASVIDTLPFQSLRALFKQSLVPSMKDFFHELNETMQFMNIYPVGDKVTAEVRQAYTFYHIERSMAMDYQCVAQSIPLEQGPLVQTIRRVGAAAPTVAAQSGDLMMAFNQFSENFLRGKSSNEGWDCIKELFSVELKAKGKSDQVGRYVNSETKEAWEKAFAATACFQQLVHDMGASISKISTGATVSNQDIFGIVSRMAVAVQLLSVQQTEMATLSQLLVDKYDGDTPLKEKWWQIASAVLVCSVAVGSGELAGVPLLTSCGIAGVLGGLSGITAGYGIVEHYGLEKKKKKVSHLTEQTKKLQDSLAQAQIAFSAIFCEQVLKIPLELLPRLEQKETLELLGVDITKLGNEVYTKQFIMDRVKNFASRLNDVEKLRQEIGKDAGLSDVDKGTISTSK